MKRIIALLLILSTLFVFSGCGEVSDKSNITYEIALLTDSSGLSKSNSINSEVWNGLVEAAVANKKSYRQYTAERNTAKAYRSIANKAIKNNAKLIVLVGEAFAEILPDLQTNNENVTFLWIDGHNLDEIRDNTYIVSYDKVQLGFLAGYAAVKDGNKFLGFQELTKAPIQTNTAPDLCLERITRLRKWN